MDGDMEPSRTTFADVTSTDRSPPPFRIVLLAAGMKTTLHATTPRAFLVNTRPADSKLVGLNLARARPIPRRFGGDLPHRAIQHSTANRTRPPSALPDLLLAAAMIPPPHVYSAVLHNSADSSMAIEVHYVMETDSETLQESKTLDLPAGQDVTLEQMTRDEGSWTSTYHIGRIIARSTGPSNAMTVLEAPMPGVNGPTKDYKFSITGQPDGRVKLEGSLKD